MHALISSFCIVLVDTCNMYGKSHHVRGQTMLQLKLSLAKDQKLLGSRRSHDR